ncbi:hypothetical protein O1611_g2050 [Lasiodiplodia mahajangana]|uniref:Uncharacterized protein n=1 Tax=Lasiodiplodia mahajangana TaxID=1108764 RepID=A0ACC2JWC6_9PEZI|nr:hypothetical protein O1611_g2050 [Lasiodiplodia mahajangana]
MNWTDNMHPVVAPDVETSRSKHGNTQKIETLVWLTIGLASTLVTLRTYYHIFRGRRHLWSDDYFLMAALVCLIGNGVAIQEWIPYKFEPNVTVAASDNFVLTGSLMGLFNSLALAFSKTSLGITFIRLTTGWWKSSLGLSIFAINILFAVQAWSFWVQDCNGPPEPFRLQTTREGCISFESIRSLRLTVQIFSCALDAYYTILPWKIVRPLELKQFEKIGLCIAMSFGCASLASGLVRMVVLIRLVNEPYDHQPFYAVGGYLFNYFEPGFSIVAACIPVLRKIFKDAIQWKKSFSALSWIPYRRGKRAVATVLPLSENPGGSAFEGKSTSEKTDTTLVTSTEPVIPTAQSPSPGLCARNNDITPPQSNKKCTDLEQAA